MAEEPSQSITDEVAKSAHGTCEIGVLTPSLSFTRTSNGNLQAWTDIPESNADAMVQSYKCQIIVPGYNVLEYRCLNWGNFREKPANVTPPEKERKLQPQTKTCRLELHWMGLGEYGLWMTSAEKKQGIIDGANSGRKGTYEAYILPQKVQIGKTTKIGSGPSSNDVREFEIFRNHCSVPYNVITIETCHTKDITYDLTTVPLTENERKELLKLNLDKELPRVMWSQPKSLEQLPPVTQHGSLITIKWPTDYLCGPPENRQVSYPKSLEDQSVEIGLNSQTFKGRALRFRRVPDKVDIVKSSTLSTKGGSVSAPKFVRGGGIFHLTLRGSPDDIEDIQSLLVIDEVTGSSRVVSRARAGNFEVPYSLNEDITIDLAHPTLTLSRCDWNFEPYTCEISNRDQLKLTLQSKWAPIAAFYDQKMTLSILRGAGVIKLTGINELLFDERDLKQMNPWLKSLNWDAWLDVPGYLWPPSNSDNLPWVDKLHLKIDGGALIRKTPQIVPRPRRDPVYWALSSEAWPSPATSGGHPIAQLSSYVLRPYSKEWPEYREKISRVLTLNAADELRSPVEYRQLLHISSAAMLLLAQDRKTPERLGIIHRACDRATEAWVHLFDDAIDPKSARQAYRDSSASAVSPGIDDLRKRLVGLDLSLIRIEACRCARRISPQEVNDIVNDLSSYVKDPRYRQYGDEFSFLQTRVGSGTGKLDKTSSNEVDSLFCTDLFPDLNGSP